MLLLKNEIASLMGEIVTESCCAICMFLGKGVFISGQ